MLTSEGIRRSIVLWVSLLIIIGGRAFCLQFYVMSKKRIEELLMTRRDILFLTPYTQYSTCNKKFTLCKRKCDVIFKLLIDSYKQSPKSYKKVRKVDIKRILVYLNFYKIITSNPKGSDSQ